MYLRGHILYYVYSLLFVSTLPCLLHLAVENPTPSILAPGSCHHLPTLSRYLATALRCINPRLAEISHALLQPRTVRTGTSTSAPSLLAILTSYWQERKIKTFESRSLLCSLNHKQTRTLIEPRPRYCYSRYPHGRYTITIILLQQ